MSDKRRKFIGFVLYWGIVLFLCWIGVRYVLLWLLPFLIALGLAYLMEPSVCFLREKLRLRRGFISSVLALLLLALILAVLTVLCLNLLQQSVRLFKALPQCMQLFPCFGPRRSIGEAFFLYLLCRGKLLSGTQRLRRIDINGAHCHTRRHRISMKYHTVRPFPAAMAWRSFS